MAINVSVNRPSTDRLSTAPVSKQSAPTQVATAPRAATQHNPFLQDTFTPARSGDPEGVDAARRLLPKLENTINTTGVLLDAQPGLAIPLAEKKLGELYAPDALVFPGLAPKLGAAGVAALLETLHSRGAELHVGTSDGKSGVSEVYGVPGSTEEQGEFVMIKLTLEDFVREPHVTVSPRGLVRDVVDEALERLGHQRRVVLRLPHFVTAPLVVASSDLLLVAPSRVAVALAAVAPLHILEPPLPLPEFSFIQAYGEMHRKDPAHQWLRAQVVASCAVEPHRESRSLGAERGRS